MESHLDWLGSIYPDLNSGHPDYQAATEPLSQAGLLTVFRIRIRFLRIRIQGFFLNPDPVPDPVPDPDPGKEKTFRKAVQTNLGVPTSTVGTYLPVYLNLHCRMAANLPHV